MEFYAHSIEEKPVDEWHRLKEHKGTIPDLRTERSGVPSLVIARDRVPKQSQPFGTGSESGLSPAKRNVAMLDRDLATLYGVETRSLNQAVRRNLNRFPEDFMFQFTTEEMENWKSQIVISNKEKKGLRKRPYAFTENGVAMLSSVFKKDCFIPHN